jgi:ABC-type branched-subunit amino acid transport system substrate-binding protein
MSAASDRIDQPEDPASFAPKWARGPARNEGHQQVPPLTAVPERGVQSDEGPPISRPSPFVATRASQPGAQAARRRGEDELLDRASRIEEEPTMEAHRRGRSLEPTMMSEPPANRGVRGVLTLVGAAAIAALVVVVVLLFIGGRVSFDWNRAGGAASGTAPSAGNAAPSSESTVAAQRPQEAAQPNPPGPQLANASTEPRPAAQEVPSSTPVRRAIEAAPVIRGVTDSEIRFGMSAPFTGPAKELGQQMKLGIESAFKVVNDAGGVHGRQLSLVAADDGYEPQRTAVTMKDLYEARQVFGIVGNVGTPTAAVAVPYALEKRMLFYGAFTGANLLRRDPPDRYVINYRASYAEETDAVVRYLVKVRRLRMDQIAVFAQQDAYGDAGFAGVAKAIRALGGDDATILRLNYTRNTIDVDDAIARLRAHKPPIKAIVMVATYRAAAKFIEKTRDLYPGMTYTNVSFVGSTALADELMLLGPRFANGVIVTQVVPAVDGYSSVALAYKAALANHVPGVAPDYVSMEGYVTANVLIEGLKRAGPQVDTEKLVDAFEAMRNFDLGLGTPISFGRAEHQGSHKVWGTQLDATGHYKAIDLQ